MRHYTINIKFWFAIFFFNKTIIRCHRFNLRLLPFNRFALLFFIGWFCCRFRCIFLGRRFRWLFSNNNEFFLRIIKSWILFFNSNLLWKSRQLLIQLFLHILYLTLDIPSKHFIFIIFIDKLFNIKKLILVIFKNI